MMTKTTAQDLIKIQSTTYSNDEIDLRELFFILWNKKLWIFLFILMAIVLSTIYVIKQPNIYESKAIFKINSDPYGILERQGVYGRTTQDSLDSLDSLESLISNQLKQEITYRSKISVINLTVSINKKDKKIAVSKQGKDAQAVFDEVSTFSQYVNQVYIKHELERAKAQLTPVRKLLEKQVLPEVKQVIAEKYAYLIYKEALLKSGSVELVKLTKKAVKATSHIKPKRALIVTLATLLATILSVFIVLLHHYIIKEYLKPE